MKRLNTLILTVLAMFLFTTMTYAATISVDAISIKLDSEANKVGSVFKLNDNWTINPNFWWYSLDNTAENPYVPYTKDRCGFELGTFYHPDRSKQSEIYYGPRISYCTGEFRDKDGYGTYKTNTKNLGIEGVFGAEYHFNQNFSFAGEIGVIYRTKDIDYDSRGKDNIHSLNTTGQILVIYHF